jgi:uncharacterized protein (TIGR03067 family)
MKNLFFLFFVLVLVACADSTKRDVSILGESFRSGQRTPEVDNDLQGIWVVKSATMAGQSFVLPPGFELNIAGAEYATGLPSRYADRGRLIIFGDELAGQPRRMDINGVDGPNKGKRIPALYRLIGRELHIIYDLSAMNRPVDFVSNTENKHFYVIYKRKN